MSASGPSEAARTGGVAGEADVGTGAGANDGTRDRAAVGTRGVAAAKSPPFLLPGEHFGAGLVFFALAGIGVVVVAPDLAAGLYATPRVAGVTHLFTLGWITTSIMGALYQFLPVALGEPIRSTRLAHATWAIYVPGVAVFAAGLFFGVMSVMAVGAAVFGTGVLLFAGNLAATLRRSARRDLTWWALVGANVFLVVTLVFGLALAGNLRWGVLGGARHAALGAHLHVALAGWVLLVIVGVAHRLLPMFLLSHDVGDRWAKAAVALLSAGALVLTVGHHGAPVVARWLPAALLGSGLLCFLVQARRFYAHRRRYEHRHRRELDPGMRLAAAGLALLGAGLVLGVAFLAVGSARVAVAYVLVVVLGMTLFVAAHYYKIVPFLVWFHRFGPLAGTRPLPRVSELYSTRLATVAGALMVTGAAGLTAAVLAGWGVAARAMAVVFLCGVVVQAVQMLALARRRP